MAAILAAWILTVSAQAQVAPPAASLPEVAHSTGTVLDFSIPAEKLIAGLKKERRLNDGAPMFDMRDPRLGRIYEEVIKKSTPIATSRDRTSWDEIEEAVSAHVQRHGHGALIVVSGASAHIYGAIPRLEKSASVRYVSATPFKLSVADIHNDPVRSHRTVAEALTNIRVQMERITGVVKTIGYDDASSFLADRAKVRDFRNLIVGVEETGLHDLYDRGAMEDKAAVYRLLQAFVGRAKPTSVLFIEEDLDVAQKRAVYAQPGMQGFLESEERDKGSSEFRAGLGTPS
ncbi:MAG: hypothetical protein M0D55_13965 [Elusimicrobiota bacterium]|nr:MAG: hypothetical protein M0D55_13965 [Elusimicrobiota bacterium]